ncbi:MAG: tetratricopeptide repeat protein, partial [Planctomycetota bacterium]
AQALAKDSVEVLAVEGDVLFALGSFSEAEVAYKKAITVGDATPGGNGDVGRAGVAAIQYLQGRFDEADKVLLAADASNPRISYIQGLVHLSRGGAHLDEAKQRFQAASDGGCARAYLGMGTYLYHYLGADQAAALSEFRKAVAKDRNDAYAAQLTGWCQHRLGMLDAALGSYTRMAEILPGYSVGHAAAGAVALERGSHEQAAAIFRNGLKTCAGSGRLHAGLGLAHIAAGELDAAAGALARSLEAGFRGPDVYLGLGHIANSGKDFDGASRSLASGVAAAQDARSPTAQAYARDALAKIHANRKMRLSAFYFDTGPGVEDPLRASSRFGVAAKVEGGVLILSGTQEKEDEGRTGVQTPVDGTTVRSFAADVDIDASSRVIAGVFMESRNGVIALAHTRLGRVGFRLKDGRDAPWGPWQNLVAWHGRMRLEIGVIKTAPNLARIRLRVWKVLAGPEGVLASREIDFKQAFWRERAFSAGVYTAARQTEEVRVRFDNLFIVESLDAAGGR